MLSQISVADQDGLGGHYRVTGECFHRTESGEHEECEAGNELDLKRLPARKAYAFRLETSTFASTRGGCYFEGQLTVGDADGVRYLSRAEPVADSCHLRVRVRAKTLALEVPEEDEEACRSGCGMNASLYSDPSPRNSRKPKKPE